MCPMLFKREKNEGGGGGGGLLNPLICTEIGLSTHFLCAQGLSFSQVLYKPIVGF